MRRQSFASNYGTLSGTGEPLIVVEESQNEEEAERRKNESPPSDDLDSPTVNPYLLSPYRDIRKHSLPTPQCTSGITASQVRRLSERGGEGSGPSPKQATFLATLSQAPGPQPGGRRHSVVTISKVPLTLFGRSRRESIAAFPLNNARILSSRRDSGASGVSGPPSNSGSTHNLQLDIMDDIAHINARKVRLKMWRTPSRERICEVQTLEGNGSTTQRYTQQNRRYSDFNLGAFQPQVSSKRRASEMPSFSSSGIVCSNTDLISILSSLTSSATEINKCGDDLILKDSSVKTAEQKRSMLKSFRSNSFDVSILHGTNAKLSPNTSKPSLSSNPPSNWFVKRHQPMAKKQKDDDLSNTKFNFNFDKYKVVKAVKESLVKTSPTKDSEAKSKVIWDDISGTKVDAQVLGSAIEEFLTSQRDNDSETSSNANAKPPVAVPGKATRAITEKVSSWFSGGNKEEEKPESCEPSICSSLKDLFVK